MENAGVRKWRIPMFAGDEPAFVLVFGILGPVYGVLVCGFWRRSPVLLTP